MALKVIGAGLGRTGTMSLKLALEHIGFGPSYHMLEIMAQARTRLPLWMNVVHGAPDWDAIFGGFSATVDFPSCTYWRELADRYPGAKVILSDRGADSWYSSIRQTIFSPANVASFLSSPVAEFMLGTSIGPFVDHLDDRDWMTGYFDRWRESVISALPPERLLVHRSQEGWEPLCAFLGVPVPDQRYPRVNSKDDMLSEFEESSVEGEYRSAATPEELEAQMQAYLDTMFRQAWG